MRQTLVTIAVAAAAFLASTPLVAQQGVLAGVVVGAGARPVAAVQIQVIGTTLGATTDSVGRFRIVGLSGTEVTLEVRRIGYRPERRQARVGETNLSIAMTEQSIVLDQVVITGTAGGQSKRELGNAVTTINATQTKEIAPINSLQNLINGRAPGVFINSATGNVGAGARVRIRGASSVSLSNEPLLYIDGVRVNNSPASGFSNQAFGSASISRMNDINPDDIESIEIIKGPAAATLYGTEASNGVIQIITKKGTEGAPRWTFATRQGTNYLADPEGRWPVNWAAVPRAGSPGVLDTVSIDIIELENARGTPVFKSGRLQEYDLGLSGGTGQFTYFAGVGLVDSVGI
jgi:TonB-dependent SusC/RagA subfamily outer membrane receptor